MNCNIVTYQLVVIAFEVWKIFFMRPTTSSTAQKEFHCKNHRTMNYFENKTRYYQVNEYDKPYFNRDIVEYP